MEIKEFVYPKKKYANDYDATLQKGLGEN
uniref:Uncharacterized protein n=1 Tax=Pithovirus LCDPAC01 TaxID=2506600 RepID=A0A481YNM4_9VIRU|nr:MAG: hypothetical protein LCDPAC01_00450 [Pithovirus LCDPAC01]